MKLWPGQNRGLQEGTPTAKDEIDRKSNRSLSPSLWAGDHYTAVCHMGQVGLDEPILELSVIPSVDSRRRSLCQASISGNLSLRKEPGYSIIAFVVIWKPKMEVIYGRHQYWRQSP